MTNRVLTESDAQALGQLIWAAREGKRVSWEVGGYVISGVARHFVQGPETYAFLRSDQDIRDGFLRVSSTFEHLLPVSELIEKVKVGLFTME